MRAVGRPIDLSSLTRAERTVFGAAVAGFANAFVPWWFRVATDDGAVTYNAGLRGLAVVAAVTAAVTAIAILARAAIWPAPAPARDGIVYAALGLVAAGAVAAEAVRARGDWVGTWVAIALAALQAWGGLRRRRERHGGWT